MMMRPHGALVYLGIALLFFGSLGPARSEAPARYLDANPETGTSMAVLVGSVPLVHTAQFLPLDSEGRLVGKGEPGAQVEQVLENLKAALAEARSGFDRLVKINVYVTRPETANVVKKILARKFTGEVRPAVSFVSGALAHPDALVALDAVAVAGQVAGEGVKQLVSPKLPRGDGVHAAVLPAGARVYISGQAEKGKDLAEATRRTLEGLRATLKHLNLTDTHVVQVKAFLTPVAKVREVRQELAKFFGEGQVPPLVFVEWSSALPIEIELIAWAGKERDGEVIEYLTPPGMQASPVFSRIARINRGPTLYVSGLYGTRAKDAGAEVEEIFTALEGVLKKAGSDFRHLAKATYYVSSEEASKKLNDLRPRYYDPARPPAASKAMVTGVAVEGKSVTLDMIAVPVPKREVRSRRPGEGRRWALSLEEACNPPLLMFRSGRRFNS